MILGYKKESFYFGCNLVAIGAIFFFFWGGGEGEHEK